MPILDDIHTIDELVLENQRVFVRADIVAAAAGLEDLVLRRLLPTLEHAMSRDARVVVAAHRSEGEDAPTSSKSLESFGARLSEATGWEVFLPDDCLGDAAKRVIMDLRANQICLLENLMFHAGERTGEESFARALAAFADVYVNDAFDSSRSRYASLTILPRLIRNRGAGLCLTKEVDALSSVKDQRERPVVYLLGGSPTSASLDRIEAALRRAQSVLLGAELGRLFLAARGSAVFAQAAPAILARARSILDLAGDRLILPLDFLVGGPSSGDDMVVKPTGLTATSEVVDVGPETITMIQATLHQAKTALLNGRMHALAKHAQPSTLAACEALQSVELGMIVGGDALLSVKEAYPDIDNRVTHISMNEDAAFDWLAGKRFFGIESLTGASND